VTNASPRDLARWQIAHDRARCASAPWLIAQKAARMRDSPLAFLRGAAPLHYELLARDPWLREGPAGDGWIVGDLHVENFGAYRATPAGARADAVVFDLNDFDEAAPAPWRFELARGVASVLLGARGRGLTGVAAIELAGVFLDAWRAQAFDGGAPVSGSEAVARLVARVEKRTRAQLLDDRTEVARGGRRFVRGPRYRDLDAHAARGLAEAFARYAAALGGRDTPARDALTVEDVAFRVAGTGSLGALRVAVLTRGKGGPDGHWVFDMKEQAEPALAALAGPCAVHGARRVVAAMEACLAARPLQVGVTDFDGRSLLVRRLAPQEDKLDLARVEPAHLHGLARHLGALTGRAHRRGATSLAAAWSRADLDAVLDRAVAVASAFEGAWLAWCLALRSEGEPATT
jgi:uncharacterized protein (DUF2252 family)